MSTPTCRKCKGSMLPGMAIRPKATGVVPDFANDDYAETFSFSGPGTVVDCWKCPECGRSISKG